MCNNLKFQHYYNLDFETKMIFTGFEFTISIFRRFNVHNIRAARVCC